MKLLLHILFFLGLSLSSVSLHSQCTGDITAPVASCQDIGAYLDASGNVSINPSDIDNGSFDNCGIAQLLINGGPSQSYSCAQLGIVTAILTVIDTAGNQDSCISTITILDTIAPVAVCQSNITLILDNSGQASLQASDLNNNSIDNCGISGVFFSASTNNFDCSQIGMQTATLTVSDASGNSASCVSSVEIRDTVAPVLNCPSILFKAYTDQNGLAIVNPADFNIPFTDICTDVSWTINGQSLDTFTCAAVGNFLFPNIGITDQSGNSDVCSIVLEVEDTLAPIVLCANTTNIALDATGNATVSPNSLITTATDNCSINSTLIDGQNSITLNCTDIGTATHNIQVIDGSGNIDSCQAVINVLWSAACGFKAQLDSLAPTDCNNNACTGYARILVNGGTTPYSFAWSDGNTGMIRTDLCAGLHHVIVSDAAANVDTVYLETKQAQGCVWPGDTDDNAFANNFDLLPIALTYGNTGTTRPAASNTWQGQNSPDWTISNPVSNLPNYKHIDANGDGLIDSFDLQPLNSNYGLSYSKAATSLYSSVAPPIFIDCDTVGEGDVACVSIHLGNAAVPVVDAYAVAFTIHYDPAMVIPNSANITYTGSWLGAPHQVISIQRDFHALGKIETAIGRIDQQPISGFGRIGTFCIGIRDDILKKANPDTSKMNLRISNVRLIDNRNNAKAVSPFDGCLTIIEVIDGINILANQNAKLTVFPNPSLGDQIQLHTEDALMQSIKIMTLSGQTVLAQELNHSTTSEVNLNRLPNAIYILSVQTDQGLFNKKLIINK